MIVPETFQYKANGKLLISGEYFVLDGAQALAIPTKKGQHFSVQPFFAEPDILLWEGYDYQGNIWFEGWFSLPGLKWIEGSNNEVGLQLERLLGIAQQGGALTFTANSLSVKTTLEFPRNWGLGTSSTLISFLGKWLGVNPYYLLNKGFGGSGYDIACADNNTPIIYQLSGNIPVMKTLDFYPDFHKKLFFIHQGHKQSSKEAIQRYKHLVKANPDSIQHISSLTQQFIQAKTLPDFQFAMLCHEQFISENLSLPMIQESYPDFPGQLKSLGAWGGDFILAASEKGEKEIRHYFEKKGLNTIIPFEKMLF